MLRGCGEMADAPVLGTGEKSWRFESSHPHQGPGEISGLCHKTPVNEIERLLGWYEQTITTTEEEHR